LVEVTPETVVIEDGAKQARIPLSDISSAHLIFEFG
jgi:ribosome maturation factor RimP